MDTSSALTGQFKIGAKTSEFWLVLAAAVANGVIYALGPDRPVEEQLPAGVAAVLAAVYALARTQLKRARVQGLVAASAAPAQTMPAAQLAVAGVGQPGFAVAATAEPSQLNDGSLVGIPASAHRRPDSAGQNPPDAGEVVDPTELLEGFLALMRDAGLIDAQGRAAARAGLDGDRWRCRA